MPEPSRPVVVSAFWMWIALTLLIVGAGPTLLGHRAVAPVDMTAK
jgi:hypothetical protein